MQVLLPLVDMPNGILVRVLRPPPQQAAALGSVLQLRTLALLQAVFATRGCPFAAHEGLADHYIQYHYLLFLKLYLLAGKSSDACDVPRMPRSVGYTAMPPRTPASNTAQRPSGRSARRAPSGYCRPRSASSTSGVPNNDVALCRAHLAVLCALAAHKLPHIRSIFLRHNIMRELTEELILEYNASRHARFPNVRSARPSSSAGTTDHSPQPHRSTSHPASAHSRSFGASAGELAPAAYAPPRSATRAATTERGHEAPKRLQSGSSASCEHASSEHFCVLPSTSAKHAYAASTVWPGRSAPPEVAAQRQLQRVRSSTCPSAQMHSGSGVALMLSSCAAHPVPAYLSSLDPAAIANSQSRMGTSATPLPNSQQPPEVTETPGRTIRSRNCQVVHDTPQVAPVPAPVHAQSLRRSLLYKAARASAHVAESAHSPNCDDGVMNAEDNTTSATSGAGVHARAYFPVQHVARDHSMLHEPLALGHALAHSLHASPPPQHASATDLLANDSPVSITYTSVSTLPAMTHGGSSAIDVPSAVPTSDADELARAQPPSPLFVQPYARITLRQPRGAGSQVVRPVNAKAAAPRQGRSSAMLVAPALEVLSCRSGSHVHVSAYPSADGAAQVQVCPGSVASPGAQLPLRVHAQLSDHRVAAHAGDPPNHTSLRTGSEGVGPVGAWSTHSSAGTPPQGRERSSGAHPARAMRESLRSLSVASDGHDDSSLQSSFQSVSGSARPCSMPSPGQRGAIAHIPRQLSRLLVPEAATGSHGDTSASLRPPSDMAGQVWGVQLRSPQSRPIGESWSSSNSAASSEGFTSFAATHSPSPLPHIVAESSPPWLPHGAYVPSQHEGAGGRPPQLALRLPRARRPSTSDSGGAPRHGRSSISYQSSGSLNIPTAASYDLGLADATLAPNIVVDTALSNAMAARGPATYAVLLPAGEPNTEDGIVYTVTFGGEKHRVVLTGDMDDDIEIIAELEGELGVPVSVGGLADAPMDTLAPCDGGGAGADPQAVRGNPLAVGDGEGASALLVAGGDSGGAHPSPRFASRQARRSAAGLTHSCGVSTAGVSVTSGFLFPHSGHSGSSLPWPNVHPADGSPLPEVPLPGSAVPASLGTTPLAPAVNAAAAQAALATLVPKLSLASVDVKSLRASIEAECAAVQGQSLILYGDSAVAAVPRQSVRQARDGERWGAAGSMAPSGPLSRFEGSAIHAQRGANFKSQAAFVQHMRQQEGDFAARGQYAGMQAMRVEAAPVGGSVRKFDYAAESDARLIYRHPALHVALLTLVLNLILTQARPPSQCAYICAWSRACQR